MCVYLRRWILPCVCCYMISCLCYSITASDIVYIGLRDVDMGERQVNICFSDLHSLLFFIIVSFSPPSLLFFIIISFSPPLSSPLSFLPLSFLSLSLFPLSSSLSSLLAVFLSPSLAVFLSLPHYLSLSPSLSFALSLAVFLSLSPLLSFCLAVSLTYHDIFIT